MIRCSNEIDRNSFNRMVDLKNLEVFSKSELTEFLKHNQDTLLKGEKFEDLSEEDKEAFCVFQEEVSSLDKHIVLDWDEHTQSIIKSEMYTRPIQVEWDKDEETGEILKARSGTYVDTPLNRKLGRVGQKFGEKKIKKNKKRNRGINYI